ncbi:MAG: hypothetical protein GX422_11825 [Deltaproteobacteria bacterium]|nr:hypothetical protein [Deltaproteobacteria bacterium]
MKLMRILFLLSFLSCFALSGMAMAGSFQVYPGSDLREDLRGMASGPVVRNLLEEFKEKNLKTLVFVTSADFESVVSFYEKTGKRYRVGALERRRGKKLYSAGTKLEEAFVILDGAPDLWTSRLWVKIQSPLIEQVQGEALDREYRNIRPMTEIILVDRRESQK